MLFNSIEFLYFLPIVLIVYWALRRSFKLQNVFILIASYFFYGWWDWRLLPLIMFTSLCSWYCGLKIEQSSEDRTRKVFMVINIVVNLIILGFFKYCNFFIDSLVGAFSLFGKGLNITTLKIILPVGISFYTFQALSYAIDIYHRKLQASRDIISYFAYVSFFPQLVAGPIERATNLLPQFFRERKVERSEFFDGLRQMLWGFFKKMVIADTLSSPVTEVFSNHGIYASSTLVLTAFLFTIQLYCDFSGYSDIAIGTSRLFGFNLMRNFNYPFFSRNIAEFWRKWHISLTTWFRDYVYIPLGGSRVSKIKVLRNTLVIYVLSGLWHGPSWTYVMWGLINAFLFFPYILSGRNRKYTGVVAEGKALPSVKESLQMLFTFSLFAFGLIFFRSTTFSDAISYCSEIIDRSFFSIPYFRGQTNVDALMGIAFGAFMLLLEWSNRDKQYGIEFDMKKHPVWNYVVCVTVLALVYCFGVDNSSFIYFQF